MPKVHHLPWRLPPHLLVLLNFCIFSLTAGPTRTFLTDNPDRATEKAQVLESVSLYFEERIKEIVIAAVSLVFLVIVVSFIFF